MLYQKGVQRDYNNVTNSITIIISILKYKNKLGVFLIFEQRYEVEREGLNGILTKNMIIIY